jgi:2-polyprenyl-3-methyl-5-hydroxy-6-metoxy-1,4-benzoquinol methylase
LTAPLPFTGERFTPEQRGSIWYEHWHRYCATLPAARGKRVLDAACGEGYGSWLLASAADSVIGIDHDRGAVEHACARYATRSNLHYLQGSCTALPLADASVDLIVSFETIEHLEEQEAMLREFRRVLAPAGALIISSPNKAVYSQDSTYTNEFHVRELNRDELAAMLDACFPQQAWYGQRVLAHSVMWLEQGTVAASVELLALNEDRVDALAAPAPAMYFIVTCAAKSASLPHLPTLSLFDDGAQSLYRDYQRALLAESRLYWDELDARRISEARLSELIGAVNDLAGSRAREQALAARVGPIEEALQRAETGLRQARAELETARARLAYRETLIGWARWPLSRARRVARTGSQ